MVLALTFAVERLVLLLVFAVCLFVSERFCSFWADVTFERFEPVFVATVFTEPRFIAARAVSVSSADAV